MISVILFILAAAFAIWQLSLVIMASALMRSGRVLRINMGLGPGLLAVLLAILGVVLL